MKLRNAKRKLSIGCPDSSANQHARYQKKSRIANISNSRSSRFSRCSISISKLKLRRRKSTTTTALELEGSKSCPDLLEQHVQDRDKIVPDIGDGSSSSSKIQRHCSECSQKEDLIKVFQPERTSPQWTR